MNGVPIIVSNEQSILMLPMNCSQIPMFNNLESNESKGCVIVSNEQTILVIPMNHSQIPMRNSLESN